MKKWVRFLKFLLLFFMITALYAFAQNKWDEKQINSVEVVVENEQNSLFANQNSIVDFLESDRQLLLRGVRKRLSVSSIENKLRENTYIKKAEVFVNENAVLEIRLSEKKPIARVKNKKTEYYLTSEGERMELSPLHSAEVVLVSGDISEEDHNGLTALISGIHEDNLLKSTIIGIRKKHGESFILFSGHGEFYMFLGSLENAQNKLAKWMVFYQQHQKFLNPNYYKEIDLRYEGQVIAKRREV